MLCPFCNHPETKVMDKRDAKDSTRRRRECLACEKRFTTYERMEMLNLHVVKKGGERQLFDRDKIKRGILKACEKRNIPADRIEEAVNNVELKLRAYKTNEVPSKAVGEFVMRELKKLDKVAYIRFASVYREFADITSFQDEIRGLLKK